MIDLLAKIPLISLSHALGTPLMLPVNITVSVSYRCNSRCKTCNVWLLPNDDLILEEYDKVFASLGRAPYWLTFSGGEPTLRPDLPEIIASAYRNCQPRIINIPTNGIQDALIPGRIERTLAACPKAQVIVNLSLDGVGAVHDDIRGVPGNFERAMRTYAALRELKGRFANLTLGVHSVLSVFSVGHFAELCAFVESELQPDQFISEIAEERVELDTVGLGITPSAERYRIAIDQLRAVLAEHKPGGVGRITHAFRRRYYDLVVRTLRERRQIIPCMAGIASAQIAPNGDVWTCCVRAESMGNLREHDYDFGRVWRRPAADELRRSIKAGECHCPLANAAYTNMLAHVPTLVGVAAELGGGAR